MCKQYVINKTLKCIPSTKTSCVLSLSGYRKVEKWVEEERGGASNHKNRIYSLGMYDVILSASQAKPERPCPCGCAWEQPHSPWSWLPNLRFGLARPVLQIWELHWSSLWATTTNIIQLYSYHVDLPIFKSTTPSLVTLNIELDLVCLEPCMSNTDKKSGY